MNKIELMSNLKVRGISFNEEKIDMLFSFMKKTLETNKLFNLTAITDEEPFVEKMIFDSALALVGSDFNDKNIIDIGTGAGFPGVVLNILNPEAKITLLDSTKKKIDYLSQYALENNYSYKTVCDRAELYASNHRNEFDYAIARAVAPLNILLELAMPLLKVGGVFIAMKGPGYETELLNSEKAMKKLNCHLLKIYGDELPISKEERNIIYIIKDKDTPNKYPREYKEIKDRPL